MDKNSLLLPTEEAESSEFIANKPSGKLSGGWLSWLVLVIAIVALAFSPIFTKLSEIEMSPTATMLNRLWIASIMMIIWQLISVSPPVEQDKEPEKSYKLYGLLTGASITATISSVLWAMSFTQTSVASSTLLRSLTPMFIGLGAWLVLRQKFDWQFLLGMTLSVIGGMLIGWEDLQVSPDQLWGDVLALLSAALHGANILIVGYLRTQNCTTEDILWWRCAGGALFMAPIALLLHDPVLPVSVLGWLTVIALALVCQTFGQGLLIYSLKQFSASFVGIFALLKPLMTALLAWIIFAEAINLTGAIALVMILGGIYLAKTSDAHLTQSN